MTDSTDDTKELDSYGVWVKRPADKPEPAADAAVQFEDFNLSADLPDFSAIDSNIPAAVDAGPDDTTLTSEELSKISSSTTKEEVPDISSSEPVSDEPPTPAAGSEEVSLDDFLSDSAEPIPAADSTSSPSASEDVSLDDFLDSSSSAPKADTAPKADAEEVSLDDFIDGGFSSSEEEKPAEIPDEEPVDINPTFSDNDAADLIHPAASAETAVPAAADNTEASALASASDANGDAVSIDSFDDMFGSDSPDTSADAPASAETLPEQPAASDTEKHSEKIETESLSLSDFGIDENAEEAPIQTIATPKKAETVDYDLSVSNDSDISSAPSVNEINDDTTTRKTEAVSAPAAVDNTLLKQIADELSGLRNEISDLKNDFAELKNREENHISSSGDTKPAEKTAEPAAESPVPVAAEKKGGFFSEEDEDDTISLSGDELSNIMNSADFTQNNAEPAEESVSPAAEEVAGSAPEVADISAEQPVADEIPSELPDVPDELPVDSAPADLPPAPSADSVADLEESVTDLEEPAADLEESVTDLEKPAENNMETTVDDSMFGSADSVSIPDSFADEPTNSLKMDFDNDHLEEPNLDELNADSLPESVPEELPDEITVPKVDDILVESSSSDFMDSVKESNAETFMPPSEDASEPEQVLEQAEEIPGTIPEQDTGSQIDTILKDDPSVSESLTDSNIDYLTTDKQTAAPEEVSDATETSAVENASVEDTASVAEEVPAAEESPRAAEEMPTAEEVPTAEETPVQEKSSEAEIPADLTQEIKSVLLYMDQLLENLPEDKIVEFAKSEQFNTYKKLFTDLGLS